jgi:CheY-like chemotaxis protein
VCVIVRGRHENHEVYRRSNADPHTRDIPVIVLTGKISAEDDTRGFQLGAIDNIHKSFSPHVWMHLACREAHE